MAAVLRKRGSLLWAAALGAAALALGAAAISEAAPGDATAGQVAEISPGTVGSFPSELFNAGGTLLFSADSTGPGNELWKSNGGPLGAGGTELVADISGGSGDSNPQQFAAIGTTIFFSANDGTGPSDHGPELWKIEPPYTTPVMVEDILPGSDGSDPQGMANVGGTLLFKAETNDNGEELWRSAAPYDAGSTAIVEDINTTPDASASSFPYDLTEVNGVLFFIADDGGGEKPWKSAAPFTSATMVDVGAAGPAELTNVNGTLLFSADDGVTGAELWKSVGPGYDAASTNLVENINGTAAGSGLADLTNVNGTLFFEADDGSGGQELWKIPGPFTDAQTIDINPSGSSDPGDLTVVGGTLFFRAHGATGGTELWKSDGGALNAGTEMVADINPALGSTPAELTGVGGQLFFGADSDGVNGRELWKSTGVGATKVADVSSTVDPLITSLTDVNGTLFFSARDVLNNRELWKATIEPAPPVSNPPGGTAQSTSKKKCKKKKKGKKSAAAAKKCKKKKKKKKK